MTLTVQQARATAGSIAAVQQDDGAIPWFQKGHLDPWDHVEAAMALDAVGLHAEAEHAYAWMTRTQRVDGAWAASYRDGRVLDPTLDANFSAYVAVGTLHHWRATSHDSWLASMWGTVERAIDYALELQTPDGAIQWARDAAYTPWPGALLTASACIHLSLRCAITIAERLGHDRPDWELSLAALGQAVGVDELFEPKERFAMDWYYPVLSGALRPQDARHRIGQRWDEFVMEERGSRCVSDRPWVTTAETCELVLCLDSVGWCEPAADLFERIQDLRVDGGSYWTGATWPDGRRWPREQTSWSAAAVILASDALAHAGPTSGLWRGEDLFSCPGMLDAVADPL